MAKPKGTRWIPLTQGQRALVDAADYEWLMQWKWYAKKVKQSGGRVSYYAVRVDAQNNKQIGMHRHIMDAAPGQEVDHVKGNRLDNRRSQLRMVTGSQNRWNRWSIKPGKTARGKGVTRFRARQWQAQIGVDGRRLYLGLFDTQEEAALIYDEAARVYFGEYAATNEMLGLL